MKHNLDKLKIEELLDLLADKTLALHELMQKGKHGHETKACRDEVKKIQTAIKEHFPATGDEIK